MPAPRRTPFLLRLTILLLGFLQIQAHGTFKYTDATDGAGGNTTLANGGVFSPPVNGTPGADNAWKKRTGTALGSGNTVFEAGGETAENAPELKTTIGGLTPGKTYYVFALFWDVAGTLQEWSIRAGASSNPGANTLYSATTGTPTGSTAALTASSLSFSTAPTVFTVDGRTLLAAPLGGFKANASGEISVFIDDLPSTVGANRRTWYDGLAHELVDVSYVDATSGAGGNTTLANGSSFNPPLNGTTGADNNWEQRTVFGSGGNIFEAGAEASEDAPVLRMRVSGLVPGMNYRIYAFFWDATGTANNWNVRAGVSANGGANQLYSGPDAVSALGANGSVPASSLAYSVSPSLFTEVDRILFAAPVGLFTADSTGTIFIFFDDRPASTALSQRTFFDGVGYRLSGALSPPEDEDGDGLSNGDELTTHGTDPYIADTDGDGFSDGEEVTAGSNPFTASSLPPDVLPANALELAPDGVWTWFNDPRALFHKGKLYFGYVKNSTIKPALAVWDGVSSTATELFEYSLVQDDDHNNPGIAVLHDGRLFAAAALHFGDTNTGMKGRTSTSTDPDTFAEWSPEVAIPMNNRDAVTYVNPFPLTKEANRLYLFCRNIGWDPTLVTSDDAGVTWSSPKHFIDKAGSSTRPYAKYASNNTDRIDMIYTDNHPRNGDNSIYHLYYQSDAAGTPGGGSIFRTDGTLIKTLASAPLNHDGGQRGTVIYQFTSALGRGWVWDFTYDAAGAPVAAYQTQRDDVTGSGWNHDRIYYYYARWTGTAWQTRFIAQAGRPIYADERDYGGGMTIDPNNPNVVYISTNAANPFALSSINNVPLRANERYELFRGVTTDGGLTFTWTQLTQSSTQDNLRPYVPRGHHYQTALVWFRGSYITYANFNTRVLGLFTHATSYTGWAGDYGLNAASAAADTDSDGSKDALEYVLGSNPTYPEPSRLTYDSSFNFTLPSPRQATLVKIQKSENLTNWGDVAQSTNGAAFVPLNAAFDLTQNTGFPRSVSVAPKPGTAPPKIFFRLQATVSN